MYGKASLDVQLQGYLPAYRDATVKVTNEATGQSYEGRPYRDGKVSFHDLPPGSYEVEVGHSNLPGYIWRQRTRVFPGMQPTRITIPVLEELFFDTEIGDVKDADLGPVQRAADSVLGRLEPIAFKEAGEAIRAADWRTLVGAVQELAGAVLELTGLVSPDGHNHPLIEEKINEVQGNVRRFAEAFIKSLVELQREIELQNLYDLVGEAMAEGGATEKQNDRVNDRFEKTWQAIGSSTTEFTQRLKNTATVILTVLAEMADAKGEGADAYWASYAVQKLIAVLDHYQAPGGMSKPEEELNMFRKTSEAMEGRRFAGATGSGEKSRRL